MHAYPIRHVSVWIDETATAQATFPHALEWAFGLDIPVRAHVVVEPADRHSHENIEQLRQACAQRGVGFEVIPRDVEPGASVDRFLQPFGLCISPLAPVSRLQRDLLLQSAQHPALVQLLCPPMATPVRRLLVLCHQKQYQTTYLENVSRISQVLQTDPLLLIVARTAPEAQRRQDEIARSCRQLGLREDIDCVSGSDWRYATSRVVSWRDCSHLVVERQPSTSWRNPNLVSLEPLRVLADTLSILALPANVALALPSKILCNRLSIPLQALERNK